MVRLGVVILEVVHLDALLVEVDRLDELLQEVARQVILLVLLVRQDVDHLDLVGFDLEGGCFPLAFLRRLKVLRLMGFNFGQALDRLHLHLLVFHLGATVSGSPSHWHYQPFYS